MPKRKKKKIKKSLKSWEPRPTRHCPNSRKHIATLLAVPLTTPEGDQKIYYCNDCPDLGRYIVYADDE